MPWLAIEKATAQNYRDSRERKNFYVGYSDGFHKYSMWSGSEQNYYPAAYNAGYWEGYADCNTNEAATITLIDDIGRIS